MGASSNADPKSVQGVHTNIPEKMIFADSSNFSKYL